MASEPTAPTRDAFIPDQPIVDIRIGERVRKDLGDVAGLAASIEEHGLLQPVVILEDGTLVGGQRRIAAYTLLGRLTVPAVVVSVDDLLKAQRDENEIRKALTKTEAVAIGRMIEERQRPIGEARQRAARGADGRFNHQDQMERMVPSRRAAAEAVGMSSGTYERARAVVVAAEADPKKYGDLPERMDESGNVNAAFVEMEKRRDGAPARSAVHYKAPLPKANEEIQRGLTVLDGIREAFRLVDVKALDPARTPAWARDLATIAKFFRRFAGRVRTHGETKERRTED